MNLNEKLINDYTRLNTLEDKLEDSPVIKKYCKDQRNVLMELRHLMYKALKEQYPCHGLELTADMIEYYDFNIVVTPK